MSSERSKGAAEGRGQAVAKAILVGEHFVLHGAAALAVPLPSLRLHARLRPVGGAEFDSPVEPWQVPGDDHLGFCVRTVLAGVGLVGQAVHVAVDSGIPVGSGLGSSAALSVALARAAAELAGLPASPDRDRVLSLACECRAHGQPSGVDTEVCLSGRPVWLEGGRFQPLEGHALSEAGLVAMYAGAGGATREMIGRVSRFSEAHPKRFAALVAEARARSEAVRRALLAGELGEAGALLTTAHCALREAGVCTPELDRCVDVAMGAGALGAKLSGAGGGGLAVALVSAADVERVASRIAAAGVRVLCAGPLVSGGNGALDE